MKHDRSQSGSRSRHRRGPRTRAGSGAESSSLGLDRWIRDCSSVCTFLGLTLGVFVSRKFLILPLAVAAITVQDTVRAALKDVEHRIVG
jgi:hypothetical protein